MMNTPCLPRYRSIFPVLLAFVLILPRIGAQQPPPIGVNLNNLWKTEISNPEHVIDRAYEAGARLARLSLGTQPAQVAATQSHMAYCATIGMDVSLTISMGNASFYPPGTSKVATTYYGSQYRLSDLDVDLFDSWIQNLISELNAAGTIPRYIQLFNEIGWIDFNGDLPEVNNGKLFNYSTNWNDAQYVQIRAGLTKYGQALQRLRAACVNGFGAGKVRITLAGLNVWSTSVSSGLQSKDGSAIIPDLLVELLQGTRPQQNNATNYLQYVDDISLHPSPITDASLGDFAALSFIDNDLTSKVNRIHDVLSNPLTPIRFSEWFLRKGQFGTGSGSEWERLRHHHLLLNSMAHMTHINWQGSTYYTFLWDEDDNNLYNRLTDSMLRSADVLQQTPYNVLRNGDFEGDLAYWSVDAGTANLYSNATLGQTCGLTATANTSVHQDFTHVHSGDILQLRGQARLANAADTAAIYAWVQDASGTTLLAQQLDITTTTYAEYVTRPFVVPAGAARVRVVMYRAAGQGNCYFDGVQLLVHPNLVMNKDFNDGLAYWTPENNGASVVTGFGDWNENVVRIQSHASGGQTFGGVYQRIPNVVPGKKYRFQAWARTTATTGSDAAFVIAFENASNTELAKTIIDIDSTTFKYFMSTNLAAPAGTDHAYVYIVQGNTTSLVYARDLALYAYVQP